MSTFYYLWRASDAARNLDLLVMVGVIILQFACYGLIDFDSASPIKRETAEKIYILAIIALDLTSAIMTGIKAGV